MPSETVHSQLASLQMGFAEALDNVDREKRLIDSLVASETTNERIGLYRGNVHANWRSALTGAYPVLHALVGDDYFDALARAYARAHPSRSGDLNRFGDAMPAFVEQYECDPRFVYFGDIARLEWALHLAHFAADVVPFSARDWIALGDERLLNASMRIHPACVAISSPYAIADVWLAHRPDGVFPSQIEAPSHVLVVRPQWQASLLIQSAAAHAAFVALGDGRSLNDALDVAFEVDHDFDFARQWQAWLSASAITGVLTARR